MATDNLCSTHIMSTSLTKTLDLVRLAQGGDRDALDRLFSRYYGRVLTIARLRLGAKLRERVESLDVMQEVFATAVRIFDRFEMRTEASLVQWLSRLAENTVRGMFDQATAQKNDAAREVPLGVDDSREDSGSIEPVSDLAIPLDQAIRDEERELVERCIEELPATYRELILLRNYAGLSFREIADSTERPSEGAARMMHAKAMRELATVVTRRLGS